MNVPFVRSLLFVAVQILSTIDANRITGNLCWSMPCMNGGSCFGSAYTYLCVCPVNYSGALCEKKLGICQENPCGNRGLCVETGLFSFECRCYFDYMGPLCEEHVPKTDASIWSSLIPVHTRVLFDILQEAYRAKAQARDTTELNNTPEDTTSVSFTTDDTISSSTLAATTIGEFQSNSTSNQYETSEIQPMRPANGSQLERIFTQTNDSFTTDVSNQVSTTIETTELEDYIDETTLFVDTTSVTETTEDIFTTVSPTTTLDDMSTVSVDQNQTDYSDTTEPDSTMFISMSSTSTNDDQTTDYTTEVMENSTVHINDSTEFDVFDENSTFSTAYDSSDLTDSSTLNSSEPPMTSIPTSTDPSDAHHQLLLKLCQQLLSHILPNVTSLSTSAALEAALSLSSNSSSSSNPSVDTLLIWIKDQLTSTVPSTITTTTTTESTTTSTTTVSSSLPSLLINDKKLSSISLQRVEMDDVLHQMNNNIDGDN